MDERMEGREETIDALVAVLRHKTSTPLIVAIVEDVQEELARVDQAKKRAALRRERLDS